MAACTSNRAWTASRANVDYPAALVVHLATVTVSVCLFGLRCAWMVAGSPMLQNRTVRVLPHVVDTALLASGAWLMVLTRQFPFANTWLTVKLLAVVAYIVLGSIALRHGRNLRVRSIASVAALLTVAWIVLVAHARHPLGPFAFLS